MTKIGFVGLGTMGLAMAKNLIKAGHTVVGFDPAGTAMDNHVRNGGTKASSPAEAATGAEVVITMLPNGKIVRHAIFDFGGVINPCWHTVGNHFNEGGFFARRWIFE